jgi:hypothetical protein
MDPFGGRLSWLDVWLKPYFHEAGAQRAVYRGTSGGEGVRKLPFLGERAGESEPLDVWMPPGTSQGSLSVSLTTSWRMGYFETE